MERRNFLKQSSIVAVGTFTGLPIITNDLSPPISASKYLKMLGRGIGMIGNVMTVIDLADKLYPGTSDYIYSSAREVITDTYNWLTGNNYQYAPKQVIKYSNNHYLIPAVASSPNTRSNRYVTSSKKVMPIITPKNSSKKTTYQVNYINTAELQIIDKIILKICHNQYSTVITRDLILPKVFLGRYGNETRYKNLNGETTVLINEGKKSCIIIERHEKDNIHYCI